MGGRPKLDKIVCCDIESTCWATKEEQGSQQSEIIQIGVCFLSPGTGEISNTKNYIIKPKNLQLSEYCTNLTGLTTKIVKSGMPFKDACNKIIKDFGTKNRIWASYGNDKKAFELECENKKANYPFNDGYIDVSILFHLKHLEIKNRMSLELALKTIGLNFEGIQHNASCDSYNCAILLSRLLMAEDI